MPAPRRHFEFSAGTMPPTATGIHAVPGACGKLPRSPAPGAADRIASPTRCTPSSSAADAICSGVGRMPSWSHLDATCAASTTRSARAPLEWPSSGLPTRIFGGRPMRPLTAAPVRAARPARRRRSPAPPPMPVGAGIRQHLAQGLRPLTGGDAGPGRDRCRHQVVQKPLGGRRPRSSSARRTTPPSRCARRACSLAIWSLPPQDRR